MKTEQSIGKVECKTCSATHAYKDPSAAKVKRSATSKTKKKSTTTTSGNIADLWLEAVNNSGAKSQKYSLKTKFSLNDIIDHPSFGPGVVERTIDDDKIQVIFRHNIKTLIHNK